MFIAHNNFAPRVELGFTEKSLAEPVMGPSTHTSCRLGARLAMPSPDHLLGFKLGQENDTVILAEPSAQLLVYLVDLVANFLKEEMSRHATAMLLCQITLCV